MIELKNVNKVYDDGFHALKDINLTFEEGQINVLIGPSGCGKTTTMKLLNRLIDYTDGEISISGKNLKEFDPIELRRQMGYVIQNVGLFPHMNIFKNVATVPKLLKWENDRIEKRVHELLEMVNLSPKTYATRYPSELSGGQQQRVGVVRALAAEPSTILMDEPFSALDPISRDQLQDELIHLQKDIKKTIIFVTHDMDEAMKIADQIILMKDGTVVQKGSPKEILTNPANDFVKEFIGEERLGTILPPLATFMEDNLHPVPVNEPVEKAIETMVAHELSDLPVINSEARFVGMINLYEAARNTGKKVQDIVNHKIEPLALEEETNQVMERFNRTNLSLYPVVATDRKLVGVVPRSNIYHLLNEFYENKRGDSQWN